MKITNFKLTEVKGTTLIDRSFRATVDVTTGWFFKKTTQREIFRFYANRWLFTDTGKVIYDDDLYTAINIFIAKTGLPVEKWK